MDYLKIFGVQLQTTTSLSFQWISTTLVSKSKLGRALHEKKFCKDESFIVHQTPIVFFGHPV